MTAIAIICSALINITAIYLYAQLNRKTSLRHQFIKATSYRANGIRAWNNYTQLTTGRQMRSNPSGQIEAAVIKGNESHDLCLALLRIMKEEKWVFNRWVAMFSASEVKEYENLFTESKNAGTF